MPNSEQQDDRHRMQWLHEETRTRIERTISNQSRAQLSLSMLEVALGVLVVFAVLSGIILGVPTPERQETQLDTYAHDTAILLEDPTTHPHPSALTASQLAFEQGQEALRARLEGLLSENLMTRIETPHGTIGYRAPPDAPIGRATIPTPNGSVRILVWYP